jgi:cobalt/nickel transport system permease protein
VAEHPQTQPHPQLRNLDNAPAAGPAARLDPRGKVVVVLAYSVLMALCPGPQAPVLGVVLGLGLALWSRLGWRLLFKRAVAVNSFVAFLWLFLPWQLTLDPEAGFSLAYNPAGIRLAGLITLKANAIFLAVVALLGSSHINDIFHALAHLHLPAKLVTLFVLFYRYLYVMRLEYLRLRQAMAVRCFAPGSNLHTYKSYAQLVGVLVVRSIERSERVYQAMLCRGFVGTFWLLDHFVWRPADTMFCVLSGLGIVLLGLVQWGGILWS